MKVTNKQELLEKATSAFNQALRDHPELGKGIDPRASAHCVYVDAKGGHRLASILLIQELWWSWTQIVVTVSHDNTLELGICWTGTTDRVKYLGDLEENTSHWPQPIVRWLRKFTVRETWIQWLKS